jgi:diacylglycerol kinase family enzyme
VGCAIAALEARGYRVQALPTPGPGTAGELARHRIAAGSDLILALGGDGTLNEVAGGVIGTRVPLGMLPAGTANVLAREVGLPCHPVKAAARIPGCVPQRIAVGLLRMDGLTRSRHFLLMAGVGFDGHIVYHLDLDLKARLGQLAYWTGSLRQVFRRPDEFEVELEGRRHRCSFALASRTRNYAGYLEIARHASLLADDFAVVLFEGRSTFRYYTRYLPAVLLGWAPRTRGIRVHRARRLTFHPIDERPIYVQVDGEYAGRLPASVEVVPDALTVLAPPEFAQTDSLRRAPWNH